MESSRWWRKPGSHGWRSLCYGWRSTLYLLWIFSDSFNGGKKIKATKTLLSSDLIDVYQFGRLKPHASEFHTVLSLNLDQVALLHPILLRLMSDQQSLMGCLCCLVGLCRLCEPVVVFAHVCLFRFPFGDGLGLVVRCCSYLPPQ